MKWYRGTEVAKILGISHTTFKNYQLDYFKRIKGVKKENGLYLYNNDAIKEIKKEIGHKKIQKKTQNKKVISSKDHPWRQPVNKKPILSYEETDTEILEILNGLFNSTRAWA